MEIRILHLYPEIMDLYADTGNILILINYLKAHNLSYQLDKLSLKQEIDFLNYDLIFLGGGSDLAQEIIAKDLLRHRQSLKLAVEKGIFFLLICGSYQLFGEKYIAQDGQIISGLALFDYYTQAYDGQRLLGNIAVKSKLFDDLILGFENHSGQTFLTKAQDSLGEVVFGCGNNLVDHSEGYFKDNVIATYLHGPLLAKNPRLTHYIVNKILAQKKMKLIEYQVDTLVEQAREYFIKQVIKL